MAAKLPPYATRVGEFVLPKPVAGHPALELCNTLAGWADPPATRSEWLRDHATFAAWAAFHGLIQSAEPPSTTTSANSANSEAERALAEARELRSALYRILCEPEPDPEAFETLAARADEANALRRLSRSPDGSAGFRLPATGDPRLPLHAAALAAVDLLDSDRRRTVRACPGHGCGWLFLDPRGRRVWCSMAACGNRSKVRAHAARHREPADH